VRTLRPTDLFDPKRPFISNFASNFARKPFRTLFNKIFA